MARTKKSVETTKPKRAYTRRVDTLIPDNEIELLSIICQSLNGMSEDGKKRSMQFLCSKFNQYLPNN